MKKEKLNLKSLSVTSFVTQNKADMHTVKGGGPSAPDPCPTDYSNCSCPNATCGTTGGTGGTETCDPIACRQTELGTYPCHC